MGRSTLDRLVEDPLRIREPADLDQRAAEIRQDDQPLRVVRFEQRNDGVEQRDRSRHVSPRERSSPGWCEALACPCSQRAQFIVDQTELRTIACGAGEMVADELVEASGPLS